MKEKKKKETGRRKKVKGRRKKKTGEGSRKKEEFDQSQNYFLIDRNIQEKTFTNTLIFERANKTHKNIYVAFINIE